MIEISSAVSSSISSMSAGIVVESGEPRRAPAALAGDELVARARRAGGRGSAAGRRARGSRRRARRGVAWSNARRGCSGFGSMRSIGDDADADRSDRAVRREQADDRRGRARGPRTVAARRRRGNQAGPRSTTSRASSRYVRAASLVPAYDVMGRPDERRLAELHGVAHDAVEDVVVADDAQLVEHVAREVRAAVEERRQQAEDPQVPVQLEPDRVDDLDQVVEALHRVVLRLDRDDHAVAPRRGR